MNDEDKLNELDKLFNDVENKEERTTAEKENTPETHQIGEEDWVERRKNPYGRRKEDKDRLLATKILLVMTIMMIILTAGILGIELELQKELQNSIESTSYQYSIKKHDSNEQKRQQRDMEIEDEENKIVEENEENKIEETTENGTTVDNSVE